MEVLNKFMNSNYGFISSVTENKSMDFELFLISKYYSTVLNSTKYTIFKF